MFIDPEISKLVATRESEVSVGIEAGIREDEDKGRVLSTAAQQELIVDTVAVRLFEAGVNFAFDQINK